MWKKIHGWCEWIAKTLDRIVPELKIFKRHLLLGEKFYKVVAWLQFKILRIAREFLYEKGFIELLSPIVAPVTDPGIRLATEIPFDFYDSKGVLVTSAILYKYAGLKIHDKIFYVALNVRREPISFHSFDRSLSEFRQIDLEVAKATREDVMSLSEEFLIYVIEKVKREAAEELEYLGREIRVPHKPFKRITFDEAVEIARSGGYGLDEAGELSREAEEYVSKQFDEPFWITDYPPRVRGFYYKKIDDERLLDMDLVYPEGFGEGASGGERETDPVKVRERMLETGVDPRKYLWLFELLHDGIPECSGIGFGVERLTRYIGGIRYIIDATIFPKPPGYIGI